jgi:hypothetical protein
MVVQRIAGLPRAARWCVYALVAIVAFYGVIDPLLGARASLVARAATARSTVDELERLLREREGSEQRLGLATRAHGPARKPGEFEVERESITSAIERVQRAHGIVITSLEPRTSAAPAGEMQERFGGIDGELVRLVYVMSFQAEPQVITKVLADLEAAPEIQRIGAVRITRTGRGEDRTLSARFEPETWALRPRGGRQ